MSDDLIGRADSLMRRSRSFVAGHAATGPADDGIPLLTDEVDLDVLIAAPEPEDRSAEITAQVTADVTDRVTAEVTATVTAEVTQRVTEAVTADVTEQVTRDVTERVSQQVEARVWAEARQALLDEVRHEVRVEVREELRDALQQATSGALTREFSDLAALIQSLIDDWSTTTLPALVSIELRAALEATMGAAVESAATRIREQAVLDLRDSIAGEIEARSVAVVTAALSREPSEAPDQPL